MRFMDQHSLRPRRVVALFYVALACVALSLVVSAAIGSGTVEPRAPYLDPSLSIAERVEDLLARMDLSDKLGQMTQAERSVISPAQLAEHRVGSVLSGGGSTPTPNTPAAWAEMYDAYQTTALATPLGIPILYGVDAVHGHNTLAGATVFPHNIGLGATRDPELVERIGRATALELAATGPTWTFSPCLCVARDDRWGRTYESFSEDPELVSAMARIVIGYQGEVLGAERASVLATAKHYVGDGGTDGGVDQGDMRTSETELRAIHLPPFEAAIELGVGSIMVSFSSFNGEKLHGHRYLITEVLKGELGFTGFVVSDWAGVDQLDGAEGFTTSEVATAINVGIDMVMVPHDYAGFIARLREAVESGLVPMERIDDAVRRILTKKFELGLFERPYADRELGELIGSAEHRALAREAVAKSLVVLTNDGILPLHDLTRLLVVGQRADDLGAQAGGWTLQWQGVSGDVPGGTSIFQAIRDEVGGDVEVVRSPSAVNLTGDFDAAIVVVGETAYAEFMGDRPDGVMLSRADRAVLARVQALGVPTVVVVISGRPIDLAGTNEWANAVVAAWLPGTEGAGVSDVLFGRVEPSGRLPMSWPVSPEQQPVNVGDGQVPLFEFGHGVGGWE